MTDTVARRLQSCFTTVMSATTSTRRSHETIYAKAERIMADPNRVITLSACGDSYWKGLVRGDHGTYDVVCVSEEFAERNDLGDGRVACNCPRGRQVKLCSHALVGEEMRKWGDQE